MAHLSGGIGHTREVRLYFFDYCRTLALLVLFVTLFCVLSFNLKLAMVGESFSEMTVGQEGVVLGGCAMFNVKNITSLSKTHLKFGVDCFLVTLFRG